MGIIFGQRWVLFHNNKNPFNPRVFALRAVAVSLNFDSSSCATATGNYSRQVPNATEPLWAACGAPLLV